MVRVHNDADKAILPLDTLYHPALYIIFIRVVVSRIQLQVISILTKLTSTAYLVLLILVIGTQF